MKFNDLINESNIKGGTIIPNVGKVAEPLFKTLLLKNPNVKKMLSDKEYDFLNSDKTIVIHHQSKPFNSIITDFENEIGIDLKANKIYIPFKSARKELKDK
jgi:hypothetical protein